MSQKSTKIQHHFATLTDPRRRRVTYPLINIVVIAVCAVICGATISWPSPTMGRKKRKWFARFLGPVRIFVSAEQGTLFASEFRQASLEHDGEVVQRLFPVPNRHRPSLRRLANCHIDQLQGRVLVRVNLPIPGKLANHTVD